MALMTVIVGYCGSGKSTEFKRMQANTAGAAFMDEGLLMPSNPRDETERAVILRSLSEGRDAVVTLMDCALPANRIALRQLVGDATSIRWRFFENDLRKANANCLRDPSRIDPYGNIAQNIRWSAFYDIPVDAEILPIFELPLPFDLVDSKEATAHHEAGHVVLHRLLRGGFQDKATLEHNQFRPGSASPNCHGEAGSNSQFLNGVCGEGYCLHEVWEDLGGPVAEWTYRQRTGLTTRELFAWMTALSNESIVRVGNIYRDDLTNALHQYCEECLNLGNTAASCHSTHSNEHAIRAITREAGRVQQLLADRWKWVEDVARARLESSEPALSSSTLTALLVQVPALDGTLLEDSRTRREQDRDAEPVI